MSDEQEHADEDPSRDMISVEKAGEDDENCALHILRDYSIDAMIGQV